MESSKESEALIGRTIAGKFAIEAMVGTGAMGAVYRARQITLGTTVALKILHRWLAGEPMFAARFLREAQAASRVDHPSSMRVIDFGEESDGLLYMAMEYIDGRTLAEVLEEDGPMPVARIVDIASQALAALAVAHDIGVIHRDIKPENIMVLAGKDDEGKPHDVVKVCDFGVAKLLDPETRGRGPTVTADGMVVGTPAYMSPEQARGDVLDARSDVYSMGVLLFHLMTGKVPFDSSTAFGTALMHVHDEPTRPRLLNPRVDARLEAICLKAMRKRPEERHRSARVLRTELRALIEGEGEMTDNDVSDDQLEAWMAQPKLMDGIEKSKPRSGMIVATVVLAASVAGGVFLMKKEAAPPPAGIVAVEPAKAPATSMSASVTAKAPEAPKAEPATKAEPAPKAEPKPEAVAAKPAPPAPAPHTKAHAKARRPSSKSRGGAGASGPGGLAPLPDAKPVDPADEPLPVFPDPPQPPAPKPEAPPANNPAASAHPTALP